MPTLGTQTIQSSYTQLLKTDGLGGIDATLQAVTDGDNTASALELSSSGVRSTGTLNAAGATTLSSSLAVTGAVTLSSSLGVTGVATFSSSISATTGTVTIGTATISTATISTATISTATISTATISTATISTATIGTTTFTTGFTSSTGTNTLGTIASTTINNTGLATVGTLEIGGSAGPKITNLSYGTAAFTGSTFQDLDSATAGSNVTTGTFAVTGAALGDIVFGGLTSIGSSTGTNATLAQRLILSFRVESTDTIRYVILNTDIVSHGTTPAGTLFATAMRFTA